MLIGVLALQGDVAEHRAALAELGVASRLVRTAGDLDGIDGLIVPGGESTTISMLLESSGLAGPIGDGLASGLPTFGTCAGMILLSREFTDGRPDQRCYGAIDLVVRRNGYGRQLQSFETDLHLDTAHGSLEGQPLHAVFIRAPVVEAVGSDVEVLASLAPPSDPDFPPTSRPTPVICRQGPVLVTAFHPELTRDRRLHRHFVSMVAASGNGVGNGVARRTGNSSHETGLPAVATTES